MVPSAGRHLPLCLLDRWAKAFYFAFDCAPMPKYMLLGHGGTPPATQEEAGAWMGQWMTWFGKVGAAVVDPGAPFAVRGHIGTVAASAANGYMIVQAANLDAAKELAASSPAASQGDGMEVIELVDMQPK